MKPRTPSPLPRVILPCRTIEVSEIKPKPRFDGRTLMVLCQHQQSQSGTLQTILSSSRLHVRGISHPFRSRNGTTIIFRRCCGMHCAIHNDDGLGLQKDVSWLSSIHRDLSRSFPGLSRGPNAMGCSQVGPEPLVSSLQLLSCRSTRRRTSARDFVRVRSCGCED